MRAMQRSEFGTPSVLAGTVLFGIAVAPLE
jgi:hypothetical protein